jgi:hypothetical protein
MFAPVAKFCPTRVSDCRELDPTKGLGDTELMIGAGTGQLCEELPVILGARQKGATTLNSNGPVVRPSGFITSTDHAFSEDVKSKLRTIRAPEKLLGP